MVLLIFGEPSCNDSGGGTETPQPQPLAGRRALPRPRAADHESGEKCCPWWKSDSLFTLWFASACPCHFYCSLLRGTLIGTYSLGHPQELGSSDIFLWDKHSLKTVCPRSAISISAGLTPVLPPFVGGRVWFWEIWPLQASLLFWGHKPCWGFVAWWPVCKVGGSGACFRQNIPRLSCICLSLKPRLASCLMNNVFMLQCQFVGLSF